jgi:hypothetical protein
MAIGIKKFALETKSLGTLRMALLLINLFTKNNPWPLIVALEKIR